MMILKLPKPLMTFLMVQCSLVPSRNWHIYWTLWISTLVELAEWCPLIGFLAIPLFNRLSWLHWRFFSISNTSKDNVFIFKPTPDNNQRLYARSFREKALYKKFAMINNVRKKTYFPLKKMINSVEHYWCISIQNMESLKKS